jgi:predicted flavoprotein YhiN
MSHLQTLMSTNLLAESDVKKFESEILNHQGKKKLQRMLMRDLLTSMIKRLHSEEQLAQLGSVLVPSQPKIKNLAQKLNRYVVLLLILHIAA